jgi:hypothetical protein
MKRFTKMGGCNSIPEDHVREVAELKAQLAHALSEIAQLREAKEKPASVVGKKTVLVTPASVINNLAVDSDISVVGKTAVLITPAPEVNTDFDLLVGTRRLPSGPPQPKGQLWNAAKAGDYIALEALLRGGASAEETDEVRSNHRLYCIVMDF